MPKVAVGHSCPLVSISQPNALNSLLFAGNANSYIFDYITRQKLGGINFTYGYLKQIPILPKSLYSTPCQWAKDETYGQWFSKRLIELVYTAMDLKGFARECGYDQVPFNWDETRRFHNRCELDAAYFHLYGLDCDEVGYVMKTFPIIQSQEEQHYGEYRTKRKIFEIYDAMAEAILSDHPYQTRLVPPPTDPKGIQKQPTNRY
ncbi:MAG: hypothetical protein ABSF52_10715 [Syntrophobacteraceae bacterium]